MAKGENVQVGKRELVDQSLNFLPGMSAIYFSDLPAELTGNLDEPFPYLLYKMGSMVPHAKAVVLNSYEELDPICVDDLKSKVQMLLNVGLFTLASPPPSYLDENGCISWLDKREALSVAYLSFGTILIPPPPELLALAEALEEKGVSFLWSLRDPTQHSLLEGFLERTSPLGKIVPWTPQIEVLKHPSVGVFVTHCGWNSVVESIAGGVPMICRPYFGDQKLNRRLIKDVWQIGVSVKGDIFTKKGMMGALDDVLSKTNGTKMRENIGVLKEKAMNAVGVNGRSTKNFKTLLKVVTGYEDAQ
ncbi:hypothetical protein RJ640_009194 [Escallonia rubra]|uniref:Uncharacterized protein n=1 Tax=Escallonia rubra TaxID=112253 RepID=A0AA88RMA0_9ASTE|nr:hypothetical protein RJ640_009194 [Escallonia rubra]